MRTSVSWFFTAAPYLCRCLWWLWKKPLRPFALLALLNVNIMLKISFQVTDRGRLALQCVFPSKHRMMFNTFVIKRSVSSSSGWELSGYKNRVSQNIGAFWKQDLMFTCTTTQKCDHNWDAQVHVTLFAKRKCRALQRQMLPAMHSPVCICLCFLFEII